jgi:hypothetical protein
MPMFSTLEKLIKNWSPSKLQEKTPMIFFGGLRSIFLAVKDVKEIDTSGLDFENRPLSHNDVKIQNMMVDAKNRLIKLGSHTREHFGIPGKLF